MSVEFLLMRISKVSHVVPDSSPRISREKREQYAWNDLAPRLIDPTRLAIIEALVQLERPLAISDLASILGISDDLARYHCRILADTGVLEVVEVQLRLGGGGEEPFFDFPPPPQEPSPSPSVAAGSGA